MGRDGAVHLPSAGSPYSLVQASCLPLGALPALSSSSAGSITTLSWFQSSEIAVGDGDPEQIDVCYWADRDIKWSSMNGERESTEGGGGGLMCQE